MFTVRATNRFIVINVEQIERSVHLMPKYGATFSATAAKVEMGKNGPDTFNHFKDYFVNSFITIHSYNYIV
jgi:hypothetical protein